MGSQGPITEVRVIKIPKIPLKKRVWGKKEKYRIESKDERGKFRMIAEAYEFTTMCHSLGVMFGEIPDTAAVIVSQACLPDVSSDRKAQIRLEKETP